MKNIIKKADIILFFVLILIGVALTVGAIVGDRNGSKVVIAVDGMVYGTYSISKDQTITIEQNGHYNQVVIKDNKVQMMVSNCDNQICVNQGAISSSSLPIVCLPNRVVVQVIDGEEWQDVVSG